MSLAVQPAKIPSQRLLSKRHLAAIGMVIAEWGWMEHVFAWSVAELAAGRAITKWEEERGARILTTGMGFNTLLGLVRSLATAHFPGDKKPIEKLMDAVGKTYSRRNLIGHAHWSRGPTRGTIKTAYMKAVGSLRIDHHVFTVREIEQLAQTIAEQRDVVIAFLHQRGLWQPLEHTPDTPPPLTPQFGALAHPPNQAKAKSGVSPTPHKRGRPHAS
jgi:hypothetical protein